MTTAVGAQRARELRAAADALDPPTPAPAALPEPLLTASEINLLTRWYRPRWSIYGDTPATQWAALTQLAIDSRMRTPRRHR